MSSPNQHINDTNGYENPLSHDYPNWSEDLVTSEIISSSSSAISSPIMTNNDCSAPPPLTSKILSSTSTTLKPNQSTFTKNVIPNTKLTSNCSSNLTSASQVSFSSPSAVEAKKKNTSGRKRKAESMEEKEQRQRERILRNRHAAQLSRDKKRKQMTDLESQNTVLKEENGHLSKRLKTVEEENSILSAKLDTVLGHLAEIQSQLAVSEMNKILLDGVRGSAASAALETSDSFRNDDNNKKKEGSLVKKSNNNNNDYNDYFNQRHQEINVSKKSLQRHVKFRNLYGTSSQIHLPYNQQQQQQQNCQILLFQLILKQALLTFSIAFWTMIGNQKNFLRQFIINNSNLQMVFANDVIILEFIRCCLLNERQQRLKSSVEALRGYAASNLKHVPRDWRKYPP